MHYTREAKIGTFVLVALALFLYAGVKLGTFTFWSHHYALHTIYFKDSAHLNPKDEVRIAGVKVGWVDSIHVVMQEEPRACVKICVDPDYHVYEDAYGIVRKEGLLGPTYLELFPGTSSHKKIVSDDRPLQTHIDEASLDELTRTIRILSLDMQDAMHAVKTFCSSDDSAHNVQVLLHNMKEASESLKEELKVVHDITARVHDGQGLLGNMLQDNQIYYNVKYATDAIAQSFRRFNDLFFVYDGQFEHMFEHAEHTCFKDSKGIFDLRIYPRHDYFYVIGVTTSQKGYIKRVTTLPDAACLQEYCAQGGELPDWIQWQQLYSNREIIKRNAFKVDLQIGKFYKNVSLRAGLIEGTAGVGADLFIPFNGHYGIISTFELYDLRGQHRIDDTRPHVRWFNRLFLFDHVYLAIGFDDCASKCNKSFFLGAGFRFGENDLKWFLPNYVGT